MQARTKLILSIAVMMAMFIAASAANASVIAFENPVGPAHYNWPEAAPSQGYLRVDLSAASQPSGVGTAGFTQSINYATPRNDTSGGSALTQLQKGGLSGAFVLSVPEGTSISSTALGFTWAQGAIAYHPVHPSQSEIPEFVPSYLGVRFDLGAGWQYGWIGVIRSGPELDAFAWGYETEPGVPIAAGAGIPEPASLSLLVIGVVGVLGRRRR